MNSRTHAPDQEVDQVEPVRRDLSGVLQRFGWGDRSRRFLVTSIALLVAAAGMELVTLAFLPRGVEPTGESSATPTTAVSNGEIWAWVGGGDGEGHVYSVSPDGTGETALFSDGREPGGPGTVRPTAVGEHYDWSPEGSRVAFSDWISTTGFYEIFLMSGEGTEVTQLTHDEGHASFASWSSDGTRIAYSSATQGPFEPGCEGTYLCPSDIYVIDADGSGHSRLSTHPADDSSPDWSPDGSRIVFESGREDSFGDIFVMNSDGTEVTQLTSGPASDGQPAWSPDGSQIAFVRFGFRIPLDVWVMNADGTKPRQLTDTGSDTNIYFAWSPDGKRIAFTSLRDTESFEVWVMNSDGTDQAKITSLGEDPGHGDLAWRPIPSPQLALEKYSGGALDITFPDGTTARIALPAGRDFRSLPLQPDVSLVWPGRFFAPIVFSRGGPYHAILAGTEPEEQLSTGEAVWRSQAHFSHPTLSEVARWVVFSLPDWSVHVPVPPNVRPDEVADAVDPEQSPDGLVAVRVRSPVELADSFGEGGGPQVAIGDRNPLPKVVDAGPQFNVILLAPDECTGGRHLETDFGGPDEFYASLCLAEGELFASVYGDADFVRDVYGGLGVVSFTSGSGS